MEKYTVSRELAQKLKEADYPQNTQFWHVNKKSGAPDVRWGHGGKLDIIAAPLSDELLEQLPAYVLDKQNRHSEKGCPTCTCENEYRCLLEVRKSAVAYVSDLHHRAIPYYNQYDHRPDALAELWLWCKANGHLKPKGSEE